VKRLIKLMVRGVSLSQLRNADENIRMSELYKDLVDKKYTDIKLILVDAYNSITMDVHRVVLGCFSEYFAKLFNFDMEKNQTSIQSEPITQSISRIDKMISLSELKICSEQILSSKNNTIALSEVEIFYESITSIINTINMVNTNINYQKPQCGHNHHHHDAITIHVNNVNIAHDIILSFYGKTINTTDFPDWKYILETFAHRDYFCLHKDLAPLYNLQVPPNGFDFLLDFIQAQFNE
jgi:hypothetical protein